VGKKSLRNRKKAKRHETKKSGAARIAALCMVRAALVVFGVFASSLQLFGGTGLTFSVPYYSVGIIKEMGTARAIGSGFLLDDVNYMVTAWHVIFHEHTRLQRNLIFQPIRGVGSHEPAPLLEMKRHLLLEERDIAVMRLEGRNLAKEPLVRGNTASLRRGDIVGYGGLNLRDSSTTFTLSGDPVINIFTKGGLRFLEVRGIAIPAFLVDHCLEEEIPLLVSFFGETIALVPTVKFDSKPQL
jgi:S1-C subfamily serine protease